MLARYINFKTLARLLATVVLFFIVFTSTFQAYATTGLNKTINFQGKVVNKTTGTNITNGAYNFTFKLYDAASSGTLLWTENWTGGNQITVTDGIFRAALGSITSFSSAGVDFNTDNLFLDITFNGEQFTSSRIQLTAAPYALNADKVHGLTVADTTGSFNLTNGKTLAVTDSTTLATNSITFAGGASEILTLAANKGVTFADAFNTSGAFAMTLTSTAISNSTLPAGTHTLAGIDLSQSFTALQTFSKGLIASVPNATSPVASLSGSTNFASLVVDQSGTGDIFTASSSGQNRFVINQNGNVGIGTSTPQSNLELAGINGLNPIFRIGAGAAGAAFIFNSSTGANQDRATFSENAYYDGSWHTVSGSEASWLFQLRGPEDDFAINRAAAGSTSFSTLFGVSSGGNVSFSGNTLSTTGGSNLAVNPAGGTLSSNATTVNFGSAALTVSSCSGCGGGGANYWKDINGTVFPITLANDLLVGGNSSSSASFHVFGANGLFQGTSPVASISATTSFATLVLNQNGVGDIFTASSAGKSLFTIAGSGSIADAGIGAGITFSGTGNHAIGASSGTLQLSSDLNANGKLITGSGNLSFEGGSDKTISGGALSEDDLTITSGSSFLGTAGNLILQGGSSNATAGDTMVLGGQSGLGTNGNVYIAGGSTTANNGNVYIGVTNLTGVANVGKIGVFTTNPLASLDIRDHSGTLSVASVSGITSFASVVVDQSGLGDLFTASSAGKSLFTIAGSGAITDAGIGVGQTFSGTGNHDISASGGTLRLGAVTLNGAVAGGGQNITGLGTINGLAITANTGTITTGVWSGTGITVAKGGTGVGTFGGTNTLLYTSSADTLSSITTGNSGALITSSGGVPSITTGTTGQILRLSGTTVGFGTIDLSTSNTVGASILGVANGGTGNASPATGSLLVGNGSSAMSVLSITGSNGQCLTSNGSTPSWGSCGAGGANYWKDINGTVFPITLANDLLVGGNSTATASFHVFGANGLFQGTSPVATIAANTSFAGLVVDQKGNGDIFTASSSGMTRFTIRSNGTIALGQGGVANGGLTFLSSGAGIAAPTITSDASGNLILSATQASATVQIGSGTGNISLTLPSTGNQTDTIVASKTFTLGSQYLANDFSYIRTLTGGVNNQKGALLYIADNSGGSGTIAPDLIFGESALTSGTFTGNLLRLRAANVDLFTASSSGAFVAGTLASTNFATLNIGNSQTGDIVIGGGTGKGLTLDSGSGGIITVGNSNTATVNICNSTTCDNVTIGNNADADAIQIGDTGNADTVAINSTGWRITGAGALTVASCAGCAGTQAFQLGSGLTYQTNNTTDFLIGGTSTSSAAFAILGVNSGAGNATASISGQLSLHNSVANINALNGNDFQFQTSVGGDSGLSSKLTIKNNGNVGIGTTAPREKLQVNGNILVGAQTNATTDFSRKTGAAGQFDTADVGSTTAIDKATSSAVFNGSLYIGTAEPAKAEVYRYDGATGSWTQLNITGTAGKFNATTGIDAVTSMTVWNGNLYIGTAKASSAEVYRYDGGTTWTPINAGCSGACVAGKFLTTTVINAVSSMTVYNGYMYIGTSKSNAAEVYRYEGGSTWVVAGAATAGTICGTASVDSISAFAVWQNSLFLGTTEPTKAQLCRYDYGTAITTWTTVNTAGTLVTATVDGINTMAVYDGALFLGTSKAASADVVRVDVSSNSTALPAYRFTNIEVATGQLLTTTAIAAVNALQTYNGVLYAATTKGNNAQIYAYSVGTTWTLSSGTGQLPASSPPTTAIDEIDVLQVYNGDLWVGTGESGAAEVYNYTYNHGVSYALKFNGVSDNNSQSEQNSLLNTGNITYIATDNARNGNNTTGKFSFNVGLTTATGAYDVAEDYPTRDDTLEAGDVVSLETNESTFVKKSSTKNDSTVVGIYSSDPALRLSQIDSSINGGIAIPVALAGRVPVKVSTENGEIKIGDFLTTSSNPGVAMKAVGNVPVFAQAMAPYSSEGVGRVMAFIRGNTYTSSVVDSIDSISMKGDTFTLNNSSGDSVMTVDKDGNAVFSGMITAKTIKADQIIGFEVLTNKISSLDDRYASLSAGLNSEDRLASIEAQIIATASHSASQIQSINISDDGLISGNLRVKGNGLFEAMLSVVDTLTTNNFIVNGLSTFFGDTVFKGSNIFEGRVTFNSDTAGFAKIKKGDRFVNISFTREYDASPAVQVNLYSPDMTDALFTAYLSSGICQSSDSKDSCQNKAEAQILNSGNFAVTNKSTKGFTVLLQKDASIDTTFSWTAISIKDAKLFDDSKKSTVSAVFGN